MSFLRAVGAVARLFWDCLRCVRQLSGTEVLEHAWEMSGRSAFFIAVSMGCTGAIMVLQAAGQAADLLGDTGPIGAVFLQLLVSELGPLVVALLVAARFGAGVAASVAAMVVTEQVDALRLCGAPPTPTLIAPRMWGGLLGICPIVVWGTAVAWGVGALVASQVFGVELRTFASLAQTQPADLLLGLIKTVLFGAAVPLVGARAGLGARGGAQAVGAATTQAVIQASVTLLAIDLVVSLGGFAWRL